jgi:hypothetical protein
MVITATVLRRLPQCKQTCEILQTFHGFVVDARQADRSQLA